MIKVNKKKLIKKSKQFWNFIWHDDSALSWVANIIIAIILIKFIIYPFFGLILGTSYPIVAVVSGSMEHAYAPLKDNSGNLIENSDKLIYSYCNKKIQVEKKLINLKKFTDFDKFWEICGNFYKNINISKEEFKTFSFKNGFNRGDIMILYKTKPKNLKIGDIIVFQSNYKKDPIIHRLVDIKYIDGEYRFKTKGDHNSGIFQIIGEDNITEQRYIAKAILKIPFLGYIKIFAFEGIQKIISFIR